MAALFVRADSIYKTLTGVDAYDFERNALTWSGGCPVVAHPPCRSWGRYKTVAKPLSGERELALWAVDQVRRFGGVVEHPLSSELWKAIGCRTPGVRDAHGGVLLSVHQCWWGHRAEKATGLYLVGPLPESYPEPRPPVSMVENMGRKEREATPVELARWLVELAARATVPAILWRR